MQKLQILLDESTNILFAIDKKGKILCGNQKFETVYGKAQTLEDLKDKETIDAIEKLKNITVLSHNCEHNVLTEKIGGITYVCLEDVTEKNKLKRRLDLFMSRLSYAEQSIKVGYWEFDLKTRQITWTDEMYRIWGLDPKKPHIKKNILKNRIVKEDRAVYKAKINELITSGHPVEAVMRLVKDDKSIARCLFKASFLHEGDGDKIVGTMQDLTELIEMQINLDKAKNKAEELNMAKSYFLAQASHDLRQPMQALKIFIYNLQATDLNKKQTEIARKIDDAAANLNLLLDNLLDISKIESGGLQLHPSKFELKTLLDRIVEEVADVAAVKKVDIRKYIKCDTTMVSDPVLVERLIRNLFSNALKYTKSKILIGCKRSGKYIKVMICDNGYGIAKFDLPHIFDEFYQSDHISKNRKLGAGLGLSIVRKIANLLGGKIKVKSSLGKGSCFTVELPLK